MNAPLRVGIVGDFNPQLRYHAATTEAVHHAADAHSVRVDVEWLPTSSLDHTAYESTLRGFDALWCAPGSPYESMQGALNAIRFARERGWPFFGT